MSLNFIDISSHQAGISLETVFMQNPIDGVIVKATEGTGYVNPYCDRWVQWLIKQNKPWGFYHYLLGTKNDGAEEAQYYYKHCLNYFGDGVPAVDVEKGAINRGPLYTKQFLDEVYRLSGIKPLLYIQQSGVRAWGFDADPIVDAGYKLWLAQYASKTIPVYGFKETPWQSGSFAPWPQYIMHQYAETGRLNGYEADLDLDIFYGDVNDWNNLACKKAEPIPEPEPVMGNDAIIDAIIELLEKLR